MLCVKFDTVFGEGMSMKRKRFIVPLVLLALFGLPHPSSGQSVSPKYTKANQLFTQGHYREAISSYQSLLSSPSRDLDPGILHTRIADSYFHLTDYTHAIEAYRRALKVQKTSEQAQTQYWIGFCDFLLGRNDEAVAEFLKIPESYPGSGMWVGTAYYWAGRASERMGRKEQAAAFYRKAGGSGKTTQERFAMKKAQLLGTKY